MFDKIKKAFLNLFTILFIATILGCPSPNTEAPEDNSYKLVDLKAEQSTTTTNAVVVTWKDSLCYDKYYIYYNTTNDSATATKVSLAGYAYKETNTDYYKGTKEVSLSKSGTYYFWIKAVDGNNQESEFSKSVSCAFTWKGLSAPIDVTAEQSQTSPNTIVVTWRDTVEASKYYIYYNTTNDPTTATKVTLAGYAYVEYDSQYQKTGYYKGSSEIPFSESGTYYFWVKAVDGSKNESDYSESCSCTFTTKSLDAPIDVTAEQRQTAYNMITVTWRDTVEAYKYYIYYNTTDDPTTATKVTLAGYAYVEYDSQYKKTGYYKGSSEVSFSESGTYYFWIKAVDGSKKESDFSIGSGATVFTLESLNVPQNVTVTKSEEAPKKVIISWRDSKEAYKYQIYYNTTNDSSTATKATIGYVYDEYDSQSKKTGYYKGSSEITLPDLGTYYFWVKAEDGTKHESEFSEVKEFVLE